MRVGVSALFRNNENYIDYFAQLFERVENMYRGTITFSYYLYENNSNDATKEKLLHFMKGRTGAFYSENIADPTPIMTGVSDHRGAHMAQLRNHLKRLHGDLHDDFTLCIDSDVLFHESTIRKMLKHFIRSERKATTTTAMATPVGICWVDQATQKQQQLTPEQRTYHYYDSLAFIADDGTSFRHTGNTCLFEACRRCIALRKSMHLSHIDHKLLPMRGNVIPVRAAFGGMCMLPTPIYNQVTWGNTVCEHHSFCERVRKHGRIVCDTGVPVVVTCSPRTTPEDYSEMQLFINKMSNN